MTSYFTAPYKVAAATMAGKNGKEEEVRSKEGEVGSEEGWRWWWWLWWLWSYFLLSSTTSLQLPLLLPPPLHLLPPPLHLHRQGAVQFSSDQRYSPLPLSSPPLLSTSPLLPSSTPPLLPSSPPLLILHQVLSLVMALALILVHLSRLHLAPILQAGDAE